ncbi:transcriptional regulator [Arachidicoccus ginsenosidimutans]|uniref:winged helix-turn-helix transcriptional regulator n=1 Tax=Arachidicoccus sp. BS20 TaxID=1850526 RepID=UPI0007F0C664|nr:helix-turn-helix domain-containing protein [Arachidicoccus sp. BS20]ANI90712.1 transcriptional regulator [Arachidicoccus sp. BS20]
MAKRKLSSTNSINREALMKACGSMYATIILSGRWKLKIIYALAKGDTRFSELKEYIPNISDRMLTLQLRELENDQLIERTVFPEVPPRVEYRMTESTKKLFSVLQSLEKWGNEHKENLSETNKH